MSYSIAYALKQKTINFLNTNILIFLLTVSSATNSFVIFPFTDVSVNLPSKIGPITTASLATFHPIVNSTTYLRKK